MTFREWLQQQWYEHCAEFESWTNRQPEYTLQEYFARYKHWLKREYRHQQNANR
jgi:hypothetical protein